LDLTPAEYLDKKLAPKQWLHSPHALQQAISLQPQQRLNTVPLEAGRLAAAHRVLRAPQVGVLGLQPFGLPLPALAALRHIVSKSEPLPACVHSLRRKITR